MPDVYSARATNQALTQIQGSTPAAPTTFLTLIGIYPILFTILSFKVYLHLLTRKFRLVRKNLLLRKNVIPGLFSPLRQDQDERDSE
jgi:hypothetical protein